VSQDDLDQIIAKSDESLAKGFNVQAMADKIRAEYKYTLGIRGDDTPEHAKYLGYMDAKELYPYFKPVPFETFVEEMLQGKLRNHYENVAYQIDV
jgi:hypothetical protein